MSRPPLTVLAALIASLWMASTAHAADGILDTGFDADGKFRFGVSSVNLPDGDADSAITPTGSLAILTQGTNGDRLLIQVLKADGTPDTSAAPAGRIVSPFGVAEPRALAIQPDGKFVALYQQSGVSDPSTFSIARFTAAGALDPTFGGDGVVVGQFVLNNSVGQQANDLALSPSGRIVVAGKVGDFDQDGDFSAAAFTSAGDPDTSFSGDGMFRTDIVAPFHHNRSAATAVAVQPDGKVVLGGYADVNSDRFAPNGCGLESNPCALERIEESFALVRLTAAGALDSTFAGGTAISFPNIVTGTPECVSINTAEASGECFAERERIEDLVIQPDGKILAAGYTDTNPVQPINDAFALARLNANGSSDTGFDGDGRLFTNVAPSPTFADRASSVALLSDGRIIAAGFAESPGSEDDFAVLRYSDAGVLDPTFDGDSGSGNGEVLTSLVAGGNDERITSISLLPSGNLAAVGESEDNPSTGVGAAVYRNDGTPPTSTIASGPAQNSTITVNRPTFTFTSNEPGTFLCTYGSTVASATPCPATFVSPPLANGAYVLRVFAKDVAGNVDVSPATRAFTVNATPPETSITATPGAYTADQTPTFAFASTPGGGTFECAYDGAAFGACSGSNTDTRAVGDGLHTFAVEATTAAGTDPSAATFTFEVDTVAPEGVIENAPAAVTADDTPSMTLTSDDPADDAGLTFTCDLTGPRTGALPCGPGEFTISQPLPDGSYTFTLHVSDPVGRNDEDDPATASFVVDADPDAVADTVAPETKITKAPKSRSTKRKARFAFSATEPGSTFECKLDKADFAPCGAAAKFKVKAAKHSLQVRAKDAAGNVDASPATAKWKVKKRT